MKRFAQMTEKQRRNRISHKRWAKPGKEYYYWRTRRFRNANRLLLRMFISKQISEDEFLRKSKKRHRHSAQYDYM